MKKRGIKAILVTQGEAEKREKMSKKGTVPFFHIIMEYDKRKHVDMPEFLVTLEEQSQVLKQLQEITPSYDQVNHALTNQTKMLKMFLQMQLETIVLRKKEIREGELLSSFLQDLFKKRAVFIEDLNRNIEELKALDINERDRQIITEIAILIMKTDDLKEELAIRMKFVEKFVTEERIDEAARQNVETMKEFELQEIVFPKGIPNDNEMKEIVKRRIKRGLKKDLKEEVTKEIIKRQVKILKEIPRIFPEGAPINEALKKRIQLLE